LSSTKQNAKGATLKMKALALASKEFGGHMFQQAIGIPMGTNDMCFFPCRFLPYSYKSEFMQKLIKDKTII
jgi:hypothetical protein